MAGYAVFDRMELGAEEARREGGRLTGWRLLKCGRNELVKGGKPFVLELGAEEIRGAVELQRGKGEKIPIDSRHALFLAAEKAGVEESEALRLVPQGVGALGFGSLECGEDGSLWIADVEWCPLAAELLAEGMLRYFSPVVRGLDGKSPFRVTSVAMDNVPALSGLDVLAAGQEEQATVMEARMERVEKALRGLLGCEALALSEEGDAEVAAKIDEVVAQLADLKAKLESAEARIAELKGGKEAAEAKVAELEMSAETGRREALVGQALAEGRITNAQAESLRKLDSAALGEFLKATPGQAVPNGKGPAPKKDEGELCLTAEEKDMAKTMGISQEEMLKAKKNIGE